MNKKELIDSIAQKTGVKKVDADKVLSAYEATILETLKKGERVTIVGFGTFTVSDRKERKGRNPKTEKWLFQLKKCLNLLWENLSKNHFNFKWI